MTKQPLVSVIIPLYNAELFLTETLDSVLEQTYPNIEIVLIDDSSTDSSYCMAMEYESINIIVKKNKGKGACAARNYGFELSSGDYIQYLDADDLLSNDKIRNQVVELSRLTNNYVANCRWGRFYGSKDTVQWEKQVIDKSYDIPIQWLADSWLGGGMMANSCWLVPRKLIELVGPWNEELQLNQDGEFFCRVLLMSKGIIFVRDCGVYYRSGLVYSISKKNMFNRNKAESLLKSYQLFKEFVQLHGTTPQLNTALGNNFLMFMDQYHTYFPDLSSIAEKEFYDLGHSKMWLTGGTGFQKIKRLVGFKNFLILKAYFHKFLIGKKQILI